MPLKTHFVRTILAVIAVSILASAQVTAAERPNVIVIVADDLGWADVGYHGGNIDTPSLDRLAEQGVQLNRFYTIIGVCGGFFTKVPNISSIEEYSAL